MVAKKYVFFATYVCLLAGYFSISAANLPLTIFPLNHYSQDVDYWLSPTASHYQQPLVSIDYQKRRLDELYQHSFSTDTHALSPWSEQFVCELLNQNPGILAQQQTGLDQFTKTAESVGYGENFKRYPSSWGAVISAQMNLAELKATMTYHLDRRAIVVENTWARLLPTDDPYFYRYDIPGEGYPFDQLQAAALWVGSPVYIIGETTNKAWSLVITSSFIAWVHSQTLAKADDHFIRQWNQLAKIQLIAITHTETPVLNQYQQLMTIGYVGEIFPLLSERSKQIEIAFPIKNARGHAQITQAFVNPQDATKMPLSATPEHFAQLIKTLQNRPYGWGNLYFYNDCSAETQSLYTPFGIWLPRNSSQQLLVGKTIDLTTQTSHERLAGLMQTGHPLMTLVSIGGHILVYLGNYPNPDTSNQVLMPMSYQNIWGLSPKDNSSRAIIGQSVLLPLLETYPENRHLKALSDQRLFIMTHLDQWPDTPYSAAHLFFKK